MLPFRLRGEKNEYALFQREDDNYWQGIAGGAVEGEVPAEAAKREANEEAGIPLTAKLYRLQTMSMIPIHCINAAARQHWSKELFVIPNHAFGIDCTDVNIVIGDEHCEFRWVQYDEGYELLHWDDNKVALWELSERLKTGTLPLAI